MHEPSEVYRLHGVTSPSPEAAREAWAGIETLLGLANVSRLHPEHMPAGFPETIAAALTAVRDGHDVVLSPPWKPAVTHVFENLVGIAPSAGMPEVPRLVSR